MPRQPLPTRYLMSATGIMVAFIIYGSLYPFDFHAREGAGPLAALLTTWQFHAEHFGNIIGNIFLYVPFGLCGALSLGARINRYARLALIVTAGLALSFSMELIQFYIVGRVSTCADIYPNVLGTGLGAIGGLAAGAYIQWPRVPTITAQPVPLLLLSAFLAYRLFPYVPSLDLHQYWQALKPVVRHPQPDTYDIARYAVMWLVVAVLGQTILGAARARAFLGPAILWLVAAQVAIINNSVSASELVGGAAAFVLWLALSGTSERTQTVVIAMLLTALVILQRLQPFDFLASAHAFGWVPFQSFMHGSMAVNTQSFLEKFFLYGSLIWLLTRAGTGLTFAGLSVAIALLATSLAQTCLPNRSAEITDAVMALIIAGVFALLSHSLTAPRQARTQ